jgi:hypothetical protein
MDNQEKLRVKLEQGIYEWISELHKIRAWCKEDTSLPASRLKEAQLESTTIRSRELCYSCKEPWEQITDAGVKGECITLRCTMIVMRRMCVRM